MIVVVMICIALMSSAIASRNASAYAENCARKIEQANFSAAIIEDLEEEAKAKGFALTVDVQTSPNNKYVHYGTLVLYYPYDMPVLGVHRTLTVPVNIH